MLSNVVLIYNHIFRCVTERIPHFTTRLCQKFFGMMCPIQFGASLKKQEKCYQKLTSSESLDAEGFYRIPPEYDNMEIRTFLNQTLKSLDNEDKPFNFNMDLIALTENREELRNLQRTWNRLRGDHGEGHFNLYKLCQNHYRKAALTCIDSLTLVCKKSEIRSFKTIRMKLSTAAGVLEEIPSAKILYNVRSPIAVANSRKRSGWTTAMSKYSNKTLVKEAEIACKIMKQDLEFYTEFTKKSPVSIMLHSYEGLTNNTEIMTREIYSFINKIPPYSLGGWVNWNSKHSKEVGSKWQQNVTLAEFVNYKRVCDLNKYRVKEISEWLEFSLA